MSGPLTWHRQDKRAKLSSMLIRRMSHRIKLQSLVRAVAPLLLGSAAFSAHGQLVRADASVSHSLIADASIPDAPLPQEQAPAVQPAYPAQQTPGSGGPLVPPPPQTRQQQRDADEVFHEEEKQRLLGVMPMFNVVNNAETIPPLRAGQKFDLFWKSSTDPFIFGLDAIIAAIGQADDSNSGSKPVTQPDGTVVKERWGFPQGAKGYLQRFGATYTDTFDGNFWGNAVLPVLLKEDPRYFRLGTGSFFRRFLYSASTTIWCRRDDGKWGPNYANVAGNFIGGAISNLYYPSEVGGVEKTAVSAMTVTAEGTFGAELIEFWPDIERHYRKKHAKAQ